MVFACWWNWLAVLSQNVSLLSMMHNCIKFCSGSNCNPGEFLTVTLCAHSRSKIGRHGINPPGQQRKTCGTNFHGTGKFYKYNTYLLSYSFWGFEIWSELCLLLRVSSGQSPGITWVAISPAGSTRKGSTSTISPCVGRIHFHLAVKLTGLISSEIAVETDSLLLQVTYH